MKVSEKQIANLERILKVKLPQSYRQFLLKQAEKEEAKKEKGISLYFQPGDPQKGFSWVGNYQGRIAGLCNRPNCQHCNLENKIRERR